MKLKHALIGLGTVLAAFVLTVSVFLTLLFNPEWRMPPRKGPGGVSLRTIAGCSEALKEGQASRVQEVIRTESTLRVIVLANRQCGSVFPVSPSATTKDLNIELAWGWWSDPIGTFAKCTCTRHIEFSVPNITISDLKVTIAEANL